METGWIQIAASVGQLLFSVGGAVIGAYFAVDRRMVKLEMRQDANRGKITELANDIWGNGKPGLKDRVRDAENCITHLDERIKLAEVRCERRHGQ